MPTHAEKRILPYQPEQLFALVADVERYDDFLPWCLKSKITRREGDIFYADLIIGYKFIREKFGSKVTLDEQNRHIHVEYLKGPMKHLSNHWRFLPHEEGCLIDFYVDFEFKNPLLQGLIVTFFNEAVKRMVGAFEARAHEVYGGK